MTKIALIGAFDRNNYGDVLMPVVFEEYMKQKNENLQFEYFGLIDTKMENIKGFNTKALYKINKEKMQFDVAVIVGGEVLTSQYSNMYLNLQKNKLKIFFGKIVKKLNIDLYNNYAKKKLLGNEEFPWIIGKNTVGHAKIIYNTVGGKYCKNTPQVIENLNSATYISVRDQETFKTLKSMNLQTNLKMYPDSVVCVSKVITEKKLFGNVNKEIVANLENFGEYFVLQCKKTVGNSIAEEIARQIEIIYDKYKIGCVLLPIGYAQGHEDDIILKKIYNKIRTKKMLIKNNTIYDTIYIMKNAKLYCGTSLHGIITATSYKVPHFALTNKIQKQIDFINTWETSEIHYTEPNDIAENFKKLYLNQSNQRKLEISNEKLIKLVEENLDNIYKYLEG